ncbi:hypothetical protein [Pelagimonas varians]|uniref:Uncharacterized protein n=1 Tax=Pelagimonas varians TaxID=696760 RepID=A0A238K2W1_9RHOB|nr:hypothetical protein [Pelagimonas varians]PYG30588.1 hypothetical protein C8N36_106297 [Pelagimonas varians]SMX37251.1 hypothetical protein PEV8663_00993 [Pelagimonas varians]
MTLAQNLVIILVLAATLGGAYLYWQSRGPNGPVAGMMALCSEIPDPKTAEAEMAEMGWSPLASGRIDALLDMTALFHVALRRTSPDLVFDSAKERGVFDSRRADAAQDLNRPDTRSFGRDDSNAMAVIRGIKGSPATTGCDVFLPRGASDDWFRAMTDGIQRMGRSRAWADGLQTAGQGPRPGLWAANMVRLETAPELTNFLSYDPEHGLLSRNSFRGPLNQ